MNEWIEIWRPDLNKGQIIQISRISNINYTQESVIYLKNDGDEFTYALPYGKEKYYTKATIQKLIIVFSAAEDDYTVILGPIAERIYLSLRDICYPFNYNLQKAIKDIKYKLRILAQPEE